MATKRIGKTSLDNGVRNIGIRGQQTMFANRETANLGTKADGFTHAKVWFIPGQFENDNKLENVAFASDGGMPDFERPMAKFDIVRDGRAVKMTSRLLDHWGKVADEWSSALKQANGSIKRAREIVSQAAIVNSTDIDSTKNLNILNRVLGLQVRSFFLQNTVTFVPSPNLVFSVDTFTEGSVAGKVSELTEPKLITHTESRATNVLYKNVGHIAISEEAKMKSLHNTMALRQEKTLKDLARLINAQLATTLETATGVSGSDWGALSGGDSQFNPMDDLNGVYTTIEGNGSDVEFIAGHNRPVGDLLTNRFIRGRGNIGIGSNVLSENQIAESGLAPIVKDQAMTNTVAVVGNKDAVWLGQGPTSVAAYLNDVVGYEGWLAKQWWLPYLANAGFARKLTGISA